MRVLFISILLACISLTAEARLYKWVDENGNVQYSDKIPPSAVRKSHEQLDKRGLVVEKKERAKTPEEIAEEQRVRKLQQETQRRLEKQRAKDRVLLSTYRSEDDIILARDGKLATYDAQIRITYNNIARLKDRLSYQKKRAASLERQGKSIPLQLQVGIENTRKEINQNYASILRQENGKKKIRASYAIDLKRFRELSKLKEENKPRAVQTPSTAKDETLVKTVLRCDNKAECDKLWKKAKDFVRKHATTPVYVDADHIFITQPPRNNKDLSLTLSRLKTKDATGEIIFLDIQCKKEVATDTWCTRKDALALRESFRPTLLKQAGGAKTKP
ncbi:DUF4124 domain-containing protein [Thiolapillus sp.]